MLTITKAAAEQIRAAARPAGSENMALRIAATREADGSIHYGMGFDELRVNDLELSSEGIELLVSEHSKALLTGAVLDYVELQPGDHQFIFINPNDPTHKSPPDGAAIGGA